MLRLIWLGGFLLAGAVAILLFPGTAARAADTLAAHTAVSFGFGLLWLIAGPIVALVLAISVIGLPLAFIVGTLWGIGLFLGPAVPSLWLGRRFLGSRIGTGRAGLVGSFLAAGIVLVLIGLVPVLGPLVLFGATLAGIGALVHTFTGPVTI